MLALMAFSAAALIVSPDATKAQEQPVASPVVVATLDTGTNPFHPCFRREWGAARNPRRFIPTYPKEATALPLTMAATYEESLALSGPVLSSIVPHKLYFVPGTNLSFFGTSENARDHFVDDYPHGAQASSQIACERFGMGANAHLVILNWVDNESSVDDLLEWVTTQDWIDVVHLNIEGIVPFPFGGEKIKAAVKTGKMVVVAAGNGVGGATVGFPSEASRFPGPPGTLVAGANENGGWKAYSNLNPHVVMDGGATVAASPDGYGETFFGGTSSSSPRITGYVAQVLGRLRATFGHTWQGLLTIPGERPRPSSGPLADGTLTAGELHEAIRKTANPNPHDSRYDGRISVAHWVPQPIDLPFAFYPSMGYGEISEHTIDHTLRVLAGLAPMPERPNEDRFFAESERLRALLWGE